MARRPLPESQPLLAPDVRFAIAVAINDHSDVVGDYDDSSFQHQPFVLSRRGQLIPLTGVTGDVIQTVDINNRGQILLATRSAATGTQQFLWQRGRLTLLEPLPASVQMSPLELNNHGLALGYAQKEFFGFAPVLWEDGAVMPLSAPEGSDGALAVALNDHNIVAAWAVFRDEFPGRQAAYLWDEGAVTVLAPADPALNRTVPTDINDAGVVIGLSLSLGNASVPTVWRGVRGQDLNTLIDPADPLNGFVHLNSAVLINDRGQIVAVGLDARQPEGLSSWYLLTPTAGHKGTH